MSQKSRTFAGEINDEIMNKRAKQICKKLLKKCDFYDQLEKALNAEGKSAETLIRERFTMNYLFRCFDWSKTAEGAKYWKCVNDAWIELIDKDNHKPMMKYLEANDEINVLIHYLRVFKKDDDFFCLSKAGLFEVFKECSFYDEVKKKFDDWKDDDFENWFNKRRPCQWLDCITDENEIICGVKSGYIKKQWERFCNFGDKNDFIVLQGDYYTYEKEEHPFAAIEKFYMKSNMPTEKTTEKTTVNQAFSIKVKKPEHKLNFKL